VGTPLLIHRSSYSMLNRWIESGLLDVPGRAGIGCIAFSPLAQGLLTGKRLGGVPAGSRATVAGGPLAGGRNAARACCASAIPAPWPPGSGAAAYS
jgi:aryl-alcohol dehydrogenase-like predicted oxidoreductase